MSRRQVAARRTENRARAERLGFRVDGETKALVERAARLERRKLTEFCLAALTEAAERTIARHEAFVLSERDRATFFDALVRPPRPHPRLKRAFAADRVRIAP
jgi:uncharacterized protein (DUF1778 family)